MAVAVEGAGGSDSIIPAIQAVVKTTTASKGWPSLEAKLLEHPKYGPDIKAWQQHRAIRRNAKWAGTLMMAGGYTIMWFLPMTPIWLKYTIGAIMAVIAVWIWYRPEPD